MGHGPWSIVHGPQSIVLKAGRKDVYNQASVTRGGPAGGLRLTGFQSRAGFLDREEWPQLKEN